LVAFLPLIAVIAVVSLVLKGFSLWYAARGTQKWWFIVMLILNTAGLLEIVYLLFFRPSAPYAHMVNRKMPPVDSTPAA